MTEKPQQAIDPQAKGPFSPLQSGCAFVMLTNMLIYLGVVLFTFNLLDPSKIDATYLATRGFAARPEPKSDEDIAFQNLVQDKREQQQQIQTELIDLSKLGPRKDSSPAAELSQIDKMKFSSSQPEETEKPKAALTESSLRTGNTAPKASPSRLYSVAIYPQATLPQTYSPAQIQAPRILAPEIYATIPIEMATEINFPSFSLPVADPAGPYLYHPTDPIPESSRGGLKLIAPPTGAEALYTNGAPETSKPPPVKEPL